MRKILLSLLFSGAILTLGCKSNSNQPIAGANVGDTVIENRFADTTPKQSTPTEPRLKEVRDKELQATNELCTCVNSYLADMSPQVRQIIVKSSKSNTPLQTLAAELQQVQGAAEQEQLLREFEKFESNPLLQRCTESIKVKYNLAEKRKDRSERSLSTTRCCFAIAGYCLAGTFLSCSKPIFISA